MSERNDRVIPPGWALAPLGAIVEPRSGKSSPQTIPTAEFIGMEHVEAHTMRLLGTVPAASMKSAANAFKPGDVLYGRMRSYLNKVYQPDFQGLCSGEFIVIPESSAIMGLFLKYRLNAGDFVRFATRINTGDRPRVDFDQIKSFELLLPPRPEQERISDTLEELLSDLDGGVAALERVQKKLAHYRAAVLKAAVEGALTAEWRKQHPDTEPASALLDRILAERRCGWEEKQLRKFAVAGKEPPKNWKAKYEAPAAPDIGSLPPLPEGWCWATISQCSTLVQYGSSAKTTGDSSGVPVLRMGNIKQHGGLDLDDLKYLPLDHAEFPDLLVQSGDLLFNRTNSAELVGKTGRYKGVPAPCSFASYLIRVRMLEGFLPDIVAYSLNSSMGRKWIKKVVNQTVGQANVNGTKLAAFALPLAPVAEQEAIVGAVEDQLSVIEHIGIDVAAKLKSAQALRQSILREAFTGQLVPQDPDDEPASELLKRIAAEREARAGRASATKSAGKRTGKTT